MNNVESKIQEFEKSSSRLIKMVRSMESAMQEFIDRVDAGQVRSTYTYNKFKGILDLLVFEVGDVVMPINGHLHSGSSVYDRAIVISIEPLVFASECGDMRWESTIVPDDFRVVSKLPNVDLKLPMSRLHK